VWKAEDDMSIRICKKCGRSFWQQKSDTNLCPICGEEDCEDDDMGKKDNKRKKFRQKRRDKMTGKQIPVTTGTPNKDVPASTGKKTYTVKTTVVDEAWETEVDCVNACGKAPSEITIYMMPLVKEQIEALMKEYKNIEWLAYLVGEWKDAETPIVKELFVPDQKVTAGSVTDIDCPEHNDLSIIGVIHSHHNMGHNFSQTDEDWINMNHNISIVVSHTGMAAIVRWRTPCGSLMKLTAKTKLWYSVDFDSKGFLDEAKKKIKRDVVQPISSGYYNGDYGGRGGMYGNDWQRNWNRNNNLNDPQKSYINGKSVKETIENSKTGGSTGKGINSVREVKDEELTDIPIENDDDSWDTGQEENQVDFSSDETLADALAAYEEDLKKNAATAK